MHERCSFPQSDSPCVFLLACDLNIPGREDIVAALQSICGHQRVSRARIQVGGATCGSIPTRLQLEVETTPRQNNGCGTGVIIDQLEGNQRP